MKQHVIIDFMHIYYKYLFTMKSGRLKKLNVSAGGNGWNGWQQRNDNKGNESLDITLPYYVLRDIEGIRKENAMHGQVICSVCFDAPPDKKEEFSEYKAKRVNKLSDDDLNNIEIIKVILKDAGYEVYYEKGMEADDLIFSLVKQNSGDFGRTVIYTNDADLAALVKEDVCVNIRKQKEGYCEVNKWNIEKELTDKFKCTMRDNTVMLYKITCGDSSDNIPGIKGFGNAAFNKLINHLETVNKVEDFTIFSDPLILRAIINGCSLLDAKDKEQALRSLEMVQFNDLDLRKPENESGYDEREKVYSELALPSLIK